MNWITRCPECATVYRVVPDQLQAAKGWLRCGQCQHVFDSAGLILAWSAAPLPEHADAQAGVTEGDALASERLDIEELLKQEDRSKPDVPSSASLDLTSFEQALSSFKPAIEKAIAQLASAPSPALSAHGASDAPLPAPPVGRRQWVSWLAVLVLSFGFLAQVIWIERHAISARFPVLETHFKRVCQTLTCDSESVRDVNGLVIDTSSFIQRDDAFELQWIVRNSTAQTLSMTALELTLQDAQSKPVVRRVFLPVEVAAPKTLTAGQTWQGQLLMTVKADTPVTGYRVLSFYP